MKIIFKKSIVAIFIFILSAGYSFSQDYWKPINSPTSRFLTKCSFVNSETGWMAGDSGIIIRTTNGGSDWEIQNSGTFNNIQDIFFLNERLGWAVTFELYPDSNRFQGTLLLQTTNGGDDWTNSMFPDTGKYMTCVYYQDSLKGFMGEVLSAIVMTTNNGNSWAYTDTDSSLSFFLPVYNIKFYDNNLGYACGGFRDIAGITWVTTNGGLNWNGTVLAPEPFFDLTIINNQKTVCSGGDLEYGTSTARTVNQGRDWVYDTLGAFGLAYGIDKRTGYEIWITTGYGQKFLYSLDTGKTWTGIQTPSNSSILDLEFTDSLRGYACGTYGTILKYDRTMSSLNSSQNEILNPVFKLDQNYPNPFNPKTVIRYSLFENSTVTLKIYNVTGTEVASLVNEDKRSGDYQVVFDSENLSSGIYYYTLSSGSYSITKKMVVLK